eukprot:10629257-Heterocapsa_arctica.AAC.1
MLGPSVVAALSSLFLRLVLPTRKSDAPESRTQTPRATAAVEGRGSSMLKSWPSAMSSTSSALGDHSSSQVPAS